MIGLILFLAFLGFIVWLITTYIPMPDGIKKLIVIVAVVVALLYVLNAFGVLGMGGPVPQFSSYPLRR